MLNLSFSLDSMTTGNTLCHPTFVSYHLPLSEIILLICWFPSSARKLLAEGDWKVLGLQWPPAKAAISKSLLITPPSGGSEGSFTSCRVLGGHWDNVGYRFQAEKAVLCGTVFSYSFLPGALWLGFSSLEWTLLQQEVRKGIQKHPPVSLPSLHLQHYSFCQLVVCFSGYNRDRWTK